MGLLANVVKRISSAFAPQRADPAPDRIVNFLQGWQTSNTSQTASYNRLDQVAQFRGWAYVAIDARAAESACLTPKVSRVVNGDEVADDFRKSLRRAKSLEERDDIRATMRRKFVSKSLKKKALAHLQDSDELEAVSSDHPLVKLLQNPNGPDVAYTFFYRLFMYLRLTGVAYIWVVPNRAGRPCQLWVLPSQWVREYPTDVNGQTCEKLVGSYEINPITGPMYGGDYGSGWFPGGGGKKRVDEGEIIKIAYVNPMSLVEPWSPMQATSSWTDVSNAIDSSRVQTLYNGAYPGIVLELDKEVAAPDQPQLERIFERFAEKAAGVRNSRKPYVLAPGMRILPSPFQTSIEMDYVNSFTQSRDSQLAAHRTGPTIAGITEQTSFAADTAARQGFYHGTLRPDLMLIGSILTEKLATRFEENLVVWYEDPTPDDPDYKLKVAEAMSRMSAKSPNEVREAFGDEPFEYGGDGVPVPMGSQFVPWKTGEEDAMPAGGMGGMDGGPLPAEGGEPGAVPGQDQPQAGGDPMADVMAQLLGDDAGGDGAAEQPGLPTPLKDRLTNGAATNGNGKPH